MNNLDQLADSDRIEVQIDSCLALWYWSSYMIEEDLYRIRCKAAKGGCQKVTRGNGEYLGKTAQIVDRKHRKRQQVETDL